MAKIYVIDDDEQLLRMVGVMLERGGHTVKLIEDPVEGLEEVKADRPDLLVLDVMMPDMSGHDITRQIRQIKELEDLPVLILTARSQEIDRKTALKIGADDYLSKPVTSQELIERIDRLLTTKPNGQGVEPGMVIAFYGFRGGVGKTTLAVNLAAALRRLSRQEVGIVDLTPSGSQVITHMRLQARTNWADLTDQGKLTYEQIKEQMIIHPIGLRVLAAPMAPQPPALPSAKTTRELLQALRANLLFTVVDLPAVLSPAFQASIDVADIALHVIAPEVVSVQTAVQVNRALVNSGATFRQKSYILNQTSPEAQLSPATIERGLNARIAFHVNYDANQNRALAQGVPLTLTTAKSPLPAVVGRMAEVIWQYITRARA
ncbi:MAG: response regulator [Anaerolineae bacterium]